MGRNKKLTKRKPIPENKHADKLTKKRSNIRSERSRVNELRNAVASKKRSEVKTTKTKKISTVQSFGPNLRKTSGFNDDSLWSLSGIMTRSLRRKVAAASSCCSSSTITGLTAEGQWLTGSSCGESSQKEIAGKHIKEQTINAKIEECKATQIGCHDQCLSEQKNVEEARRHDACVQTVDNRLSNAQLVYLGSQNYSLDPDIYFVRDRDRHSSVYESASHDDNDVEMDKDSELSSPQIPIQPVPAVVCKSTGFLQQCAHGDSFQNERHKDGQKIGSSFKGQLSDNHTQGLTAEILGALNNLKSYFRARRNNEEINSLQRNINNETKVSSQAVQRACGDGSVASYLQGTSELAPHNLCPDNDKIDKNNKEIGSLHRNSNKEAKVSSQAVRRACGVDSVASYVRETSELAPHNLCPDNDKIDNMSPWEIMENREELGNQVSEPCRECTVDGARLAIGVLD